MDEGLTMRHAALGAGVGGLHSEAPRCPSAPLPQSWRIPSSRDKNGSMQGPWELVTPPVCQEIDFGSRLLVSGCGKRGESCQPGACPGNSKSRSSRALSSPQRLLRLLSRTAGPNPLTSELSCRCTPHLGSPARSVWEGLCG